VLATPILVLQQVRGALFFDVGAGHFEGQPFQFINEGKLVNGRAAAGIGVSFNLLGLQVNFDFARRYTADGFEKKTRSSFWIGQQF
jgi:outer membrane protein assembly factor BamA